MVFLSFFLSSPYQSSFYVLESKKRVKIKQIELSFSENFHLLSNLSANLAEKRLKSEFIFRLNFCRYAINWDELTSCSATSISLIWISQYGIWEAAAAGEGGKRSGISTIRCAVSISIRSCLLIIERKFDFNPLPNNNSKQYLLAKEKRFQ